MTPARYARPMAGAFTLSSRLEDLAARGFPGLTPRAVQDLRTLGITNVGTLIAHLPLRHERQAAESTIAELVEGSIVTARGEVTATRVSGRGKKGRLEAVLMDDSGRLDVAWFSMPYMRDVVRPGVRLRVQGKLGRYGRALQLVNPRTEVLAEGKDEPGLRGERLRPVYPASETIESRRIERAIDAVLDRALPLIEDHLPEAYRAERALPALAEAYRMVHRPADEDEAARARRRLAYDELLLLQLGVHLKRTHRRRTLKAPALRVTDAIDRHIRARFPFTLTPEQDKVVGEISRDLAKDTPANRLVQGDVGSGKTAVALYAMLLAVASGKQALLMAPTELLAEQHEASMARMLSGSRVRVALLTGSLGGAERDALLAGVASGEVDLVIGTHALLDERVRFKDLAVAIIDEQHRFGVSQRAALRIHATHDGREPHAPHVLVMTATPIPRTLAITLFGDLDISTIRGMPPGRLPITTRHVGIGGRAGAYAEVAQRLERGEQAYIVVPTIEGSTKDAMKGVRALMAELEASWFKGRRLAVMHGELSRATREAIMDRFRRGEIDALVATTIIEVGVDVPNATAMVIEHADRFGLAQLHQLRGRVGRGEKPSICILIADPTTDEARARLEVMAGENDGFVIAERDFEIRGPGDVLGTRQSGMPPFRVADLVRDRDLLAMAQRDAAAWIERSPALAHADEAVLLRRLRKAHGEWLHLADVG